MSLKISETLKKIIRKSPALNAWASIFKNADFLVELCKTYKNWKYFDILSHLKFFFFFVINGPTIISK